MQSLVAVKPKEQLSGFLLLLFFKVEILQIPIWIYVDCSSPKGTCLRNCSTMGDKRLRQIYDELQTIKRERLIITQKNPNR